MADIPAVDITSPAFASRLANLLIATRTRNGMSVRQVARSSGGRFGVHDLKGFEAGTRPVDESVLDELGQLYRCDLGVILPTRLPIVVDERRISTGGVEQQFEPGSADALLAAYLALVRTLRRQRKSPVVELRRDDIAALAVALHEPHESVLNRLATLMNASQTKRTAMIGVLATGAAVIGLVGTAVALGDPEPSRTETPVTTTIVQDSTTDTTPDTSVTTTLTATTTPATTSPTTTPTTTAPAATPATTARSTRTTTAVTAPPAGPGTTAVDTGTPPIPTTTIVDIGTPPLPTTTTIVDIGTPPLPTPPSTVSTP